MMLRNITASLSISALTLLAACGGGGGGSSTPASLSGIIIDSPVKGLVYTGNNSQILGTSTGSAGNYSVSTNDTVIYFCLPSATPQLCTPDKAIFNLPAPTATNQQTVVTDLMGGVQVAQLLQSVGVPSGSGASSVLDISSFASSASNTTSNISAIRDYINSGGTAAKPSFVTVSASTAISNVASYLTSVASPPPIPSGYFNSSTFLALAPCQNYLMFGSFNANGIWTNWLNQTTATSSVSGSNITFTQLSAGTTYTDVVSFPILSSGGGTYYDTQTTTPASGSSTTQSCNGIFTKIDSSANGLTLANIAGKRLTVTLAGDGYPYNQFCSDNKIIYTMSTVQNGTVSYTRSCNTNITRTNPFQTSGYVSAVNNNLQLPAGLLVFSDSNAYVMGLVNGGLLSSGSLAMTFLNGPFKYNNISNGVTPYPVIAQFTLQ